jgi:hypothetical protein
VAPLLLDLRAKRLDEKSKIYVARPGANYRFYDLFVERNFVGPDLPALNLPHFNDISEIPIYAHVARAAEIRRWHLAGRREDLAPDRDIDYYLDRTYGRSVSQLSRVVKAYFGGMQKGDLLVVPPASFRGLAQIGELTDEPNDVVRTYVDRYGSDWLEGRHVNWLASFPKSDLPATTLDALQKPSPLFLLPRDYMPKIFRRAYGTYYSDGEYSVRFEVKSEKFRTEDDLYIQGFFGFVTSNTLRVMAGQAEMLAFAEGAFAAKGDSAPELFTNVNSPGGISLKSALITPIVISALFTLAVVVGPEAQTLAEQALLQVTNSAVAADDICTAEVNHQVITQLRLLGYNRWVEACNFARDAANATGLESEATIIGGP